MNMMIRHTVEEVAKHNKKGDVWAVLNGRILNVSNLLSLHPGGKLAILTFGGKDAAAEFDMVQPPDVVEKYAPDAIFGVLGSGKPKKAKGAAKSALPVPTDQGYAVLERPVTLTTMDLASSESLDGMKVDTSLKWFASSPHSSPTLRSRSPCASWAPPLHRGPVR